MIQVCSDEKHAEHIRHTEPGRPQHNRAEQEEYKKIKFHRDRIAGTQFQYFAEINERSCKCQNRSKLQSDCFIGSNERQQRSPERISNGPEKISRLNST